MIVRDRNENTSSDAASNDGVNAAIAAADKAEAERELRLMTKFGRTHGGYNRGTNLLFIVTGVLLLGTLIIGLTIGNITLGVEYKYGLLLAFAGVLFVIDMTVLFGYFKVRYALLMLFATVFSIVAFFATLYAIGTVL